MSPVHAFLEPLESSALPGSLTGQQRAAAEEDRRRAAFDEGHRQGIAEGMRTRALETGDALAKLQGDISALAADFGAAKARADQETLELMRDILEKILPELCRQGFAEDALSVIGGVLRNLPSLDVAIAVPADLVETVREGLSLETRDGNLSVSELADKAATAQAELVWAEGRATIDLDRVSGEIIETLNEHIANIQSQAIRNDHGGQ